MKSDRTRKGILQPSIDRESLERQVHSFGEQIFSQIDSAKPGWLSPDYYTDMLLDWSMRDDDLKVSLFRFVDILPALREPEAVVSHAQEFAEILRQKIPPIIKWGLLAVDPKSLSAKLMARLIRRQVRGMAERFIVGESPELAIAKLRQIRRAGFAFTIDLLGEATVSEPEAATYLQRYLALLSVVASDVSNWPESAPLINGHRGERSASNISVKLSALYSHSRPLNFTRSVEELSDRLRQILHEAQKTGTFVYVDMEDSSLTDIVLETFKRVADTAQFRTSDSLGIVLQAYLRRTPQDLDQLLEWAQRRGAPVAVRLVKGAYWDTETILAKQRAWPVPVWQHKSCTDAAYETLSLKLLANSHLIFPAFGSHNIRSLCFATSAAEMLEVPTTNFELQALYGMADPIKKAFTNRGYLVREYAPIGDLIDGMGYLVRRLLENTSNEGFLRQSFHDRQNPSVMLTRPQFVKADLGIEHLASNPREEFKNATLLDFSLSDTRQALTTAITTTRDRLVHKPELVAPIIDGIASATAQLVDVRICEDPTKKIGSVSLANVELCKHAVEALSQAYPRWRNTAVEERAEILFRTAAIFEQRRNDLVSLMVLEEGKQWSEADADLAEAVDFCNYYALEALKLGRGERLGKSYPGEMNLYFHEPRGIAVVISPWNFPLAIPCGMVAAALATGNVVILKPAEQANLVAYEMFRCLLEAGLPPDTLAFLPGLGEEIGPFLVSHPLTSTIAFTGSKEVGLSIFSTAGRIVEPGMPHLKRVIAEMGGKNVVIVDDDADLDEAVKGVIYSAFGYQGQKCSACSRVIAVGRSYERFLSRFSEATRSILVGPASDPTALVGPVIDRESFLRIQGVIEESRTKCTVVAEGPYPPSNVPHSYYIRPTVFADIPKGHPLLTNELFGPVVAVTKAADFSSAVKEATDLEYALTGGVFSRSPKNINFAIREFKVGNLYINRGCTGALVNRQPFGGFKLSGVGSKAGGPDYLLQFVVPRSISENTMRRGFAPE